jgi:hypothetical protein
MYWLTKLALPKLIDCGCFHRARRYADVTSNKPEGMIWALQWEIALRTPLAYHFPTSSIYVTSILLYEMAQRPL